MYYSIYDKKYGKNDEDNYGLYNFIGIVKTEEEAKRICERQNSILDLDTEEANTRFCYKKVNKDVPECNLLNTSFLNCKFFSAAVTFLPNGKYHIATIDDCFDRSKNPLIIKQNNNVITVFSSFPFGVSKDELVEMARKLIN